MVGHDVTGPAEPEDGQAGQDVALVGDRRRMHDVVGGDPVAGDHEQAVRQVVELADLPAGEQRQVGDGGGRHAVTVAAVQDADGRARGTIRNVRERMAAALALGLAAVACGAATGRVERGPSIAGCPVFPASNAWNRDVSRAPVDRRSDAYVRSIGAGRTCTRTSARTRYGIPVRSCRPASARCRSASRLRRRERPGPYPIPPRARIEGGRTATSSWSQRGTAASTSCSARARRRAAGRPPPARLDLRSNRLRPAGWTSADAAGLPILPGLVALRRGGGPARSATRCA